MSSFNSKFMQKSWLNDVSPPSSICTSMDFQNVDNMMNSLITSSDFSNLNFLLDGNDANNKDINETITFENVSPTKNLTRNLMVMDSTYDATKRDLLRGSTTFIADSEPMKEFGINNADITLCDSSENINGSKNLTYNAYTNNGNLTWDKIQEHQNMMHATIVQSTPVHQYSDDDRLKKTFDHTMSPISRSQITDENDEVAEVVIRSLKGRRLVNDVTIDDYRNSMEDQCEFLLNEETIKLSSRVCGDTIDTLEMKSEKDFDKMLDTFNVKKSLESEKLLQSVDTIKLRHSLINFEKQREEKLKKDDDSDNRTQYETMSKSNERLLRRSRLYDDVNLQLQKQQNETHDANTQDPNGEDQDDIIDKSNRDRFKTIKLNKKLQSGMVIVNDEAEGPVDESSTSPGANKERQNKLNQKTQESEDVEFKRPLPAPSRLSKFGYSRPTYRSRQDLNLPLKANSTDSLDNDEPRTSAHSNLKSPMGIKSKSIHNLMYNGNSAVQPGSRMGSYGNLKLSSKSQTSLKGSRASSLVRQDPVFKVIYIYFRLMIQLKILKFPIRSRHRYPHSSIHSRLKYEHQQAARHHSHVHPLATMELTLQSI